MKMIIAGAKGFVLKQATSLELETCIRDVYNGNNFFSHELLRTVITQMQDIEQEIRKEKKQLLNLSDRDVEFLNCMCKGLTNQEIADKYFISIRTIEASKSKMMKKTNTRNNTGLIIWAIKNKMVRI